MTLKTVHAFTCAAAALTFVIAVWFDLHRHETPSSRQIAAEAELQNVLEGLIMDSRSMTDDEMLNRARIFVSGRAPDYLVRVADNLLATREMLPGRMGVYILEAGAERGYGGLAWRAASRYMTGSFVEKDIDKARRLFDHPSVLVDRWAKFRLALILLESGEDERGEQLMREAADAGVPPAERWISRRAAAGGEQQMKRP